MKSFSWSPKENILAYWVAEDKVGKIFSVLSKKASIITGISAEIKIFLKSTKECCRK